MTDSFNANNSSTSEKPNYRQIGTKPSGNPMRGAVAHKQHPRDTSKKVSSIPSKYDTILLRETHQSNGFGNRTTRFGESDNELPGPGSYYKPSTLVRKSDECGSVSKLGYSVGFVSKSKRFNDRVRDAPPGPGQYQAPTIAERKSFSHKPVSSSFASTRFPISNNTEVSSVPGPGEYEISRESPTLKRNIAGSAFSSKSTRGFDPKIDVPAPGDYENVVELARSLAQGKKSPQSMFKSTVKRVGTETSSLTPGPGAYEAAIAEQALKYDWISRAHGSAVFQKGVSDRFGRTPSALAADTEPGPGSYELGLRSETKPYSSVFKSHVERTDGSFGGSNKSPGPGFYHPSSPDKKSYMLNSNKKWL